MKKVIIYYSKQGKEIYRDWECLFNPTLGIKISFIGSNPKFCNLLEHEISKKFIVKDIVLQVPDCLYVFIEEL